MKVSYKWLKQYIDIDLPASEMEKHLTASGLEIGGIENYSSTGGALDGFVIGRVEDTAAHPNADKLTLTKITIGARLEKQRRKRFTRPLLTLRDES